MLLNQPWAKDCLEKLFLMDEFSDVKLLCEDKIFPCHRNILGSQSEVFKTMLSNTNMFEASSQGILAY